MEWWIIRWFSVQKHIFCAARLIEPVVAPQKPLDDPATELTIDLDRVAIEDPEQRSRSEVAAILTRVEVVNTVSDVTLVGRSRVEPVAPRLEGGDLEIWTAARASVEPLVSAATGFQVRHQPTEFELAPRKAVVVRHALCDSVVLSSPPRSFATAE
jgi:hypothetical protein